MCSHDSSTTESYRRMWEPCCHSQTFAEPTRCSPVHPTKEEKSFCRCQTQAEVRVPDQETLMWGCIRSCWDAQSGCPISRAPSAREVGLLTRGCPFACSQPISVGPSRPFHSRGPGRAFSLLDGPALPPVPARAAYTHLPRGHPILVRKSGQ